MSNQKEYRRFQSVTVGRAAELAEKIARDREPEEIDEMLELIIGIADELGDAHRFEAAMAAMRHLHAMRSDAWVTHLLALQMVSAEGRPMQ